MEILIVFVILLTLVTIMLSNLNFGVLTNRGYDARRKKDLARMKVAFEEYFNDKGCYPTQAYIDSQSCDGTGFRPWLARWPCDPGRVAYVIGIDNSPCPRWFKIGTQLRDRKDPDIPAGWYDQSGLNHFIDGVATIEDVNYGVSSTNVTWSGLEVNPGCFTGFTGCYVKPGPGRCNALPLGQKHFSAYLHPDCLPECLVACCLDGQVCN